MILRFLGAQDGGIYHLPEETIAGWVCWELGSEMESGVRFIRGCSWINTRVAGRGKQVWAERKKLGCDAVSVETSAKATGVSEVRMIPQSCPKLGRGAGSLYPDTGQALDAGDSRKGMRSWERGPL